jgi:hypothetical protein
MLNLSTWSGMYLRGRLFNRDREIRSHTPFFRLNGTLPIDGLIKETIEPVLVRKTV